MSGAATDSSGSTGGAGEPASGAASPDAAALVVLQPPAAPYAPYHHYDDLGEHLTEILVTLPMADCGRLKTENIKGEASAQNTPPRNRPLISIIRSTTRRVPECALGARQFICCGSTVSTNIDKRQTGRALNANLRTAIN
ncbi:hypothetical protein EVAR_41535_1 [Eumeta japonica]|uniref:Uncharacterized protein n=1 Tax=Eumeta variegata TaxID=151549 RepID=A0A4C1X6K6_EUMVA|nr:hypothetical protein EVAR_41535_1 [Eumeta japonica]